MVRRALPRSLHPRSAAPARVATLVASLALIPGLARGGDASLPARSGETPLLRDDLKANQRTRIDAPRDELDAELDKVLGSGGGFSTKDLERVGERIKSELRRDRARAAPRLLVFVYPGRITVERLRSMAEVVVDVELVIEDCERSVCRDAVGGAIELVGRAIGEAALSGQGYKLRFQNLLVQTFTPMRDAELGAYRVPIADCITAARRPGGGLAWLKERSRQAEDYENLVARGIVKRAAERRLSLKGPPSVKRSPTGVDVTLTIDADRSRVQGQVMDAMAAAARALADNATTPTETTIEVTALVALRGQAPQRYRAPGPQVQVWLDGRLSASAFWSTYVEQRRPGGDAAQVRFDDDSARGGGDDSEGPEPDDQEALAVLGANFDALSRCVRAEAALRPSFRGVTVTFSWQPSGVATEVRPKEAALRTGPLAGCLRSAMAQIRLPRFGGAPRVIEYPILVK